MDLGPCNGWQDALGEQVSHREGGQGQEEGSAQVLGAGGYLLVLLCQRPGVTHQRFLVSGQAGFDGSQFIQQSACDDADHIGNGQDNDGVGVVAGRRFPGGPFVNLGQRHGSCSISAAHNGQRVLDDNVGGADAEDRARDHAEQHGTGQTAQDRRNVARKGLEQDFPVQGQDGAGDQKYNENVQQVGGALDYLPHGLRVFLRQNVELHQHGGSEEHHQKAAADVAVPDGEPLAEFIQKRGHRAAEGQRARHIRAQSP